MAYEYSSTLKGISVAILAGGLGTRLTPLVSDRPKAMALVRGRPFLTWVLEFLTEFGFADITLCTGYRSDQIESYYGGLFKSARLAYSTEKALLGTAGALRLAANRLNSEDVLILNGDSLCRADLKEFVLLHIREQSKCSLVVTQVDEVGRYGQVQIDECGIVTNFVEKGNSAGFGWVNAGIYLVKRDWLMEIPAGQTVSLEREIFPTWLVRRIRAVPTAAPLLDIGTPDSFAAANQSSVFAI